MDKETLSHYGWIVILVLILSCLLAFATPFGNFIATGIKAFAAGFVDVNNEAISNDHMQNIQDKWEDQLNDCEHEYTRLANQKTATCQSAGYTGDKVCNGCGKTMETGTVIEKLDHTPVTDEAVPATCEQEGKTEGSHCSSCNTVLVAQTTIDALGHDWGDPYVATEATCLGNGISRIDCQREGCNTHTDSTIKAEGHTIVTVNGKVATCTATGLTNGEKCSVCGTITEEQQVIPAKGHSYGTPTYTWTGTTACKASRTCSACSNVDSQNGTITNAVTTAAKCTTAGVRTYTAKFSNTAFATQTKTESIAATGHTEVTDNAVSATCTATGLTAGKHCSVCNTVLTAQTTTPALGHSYGTPTYTWTGTTACKASRTCSRCGNVESQNGTITNAVTTAAKCTTAGVRTYTAKFSNTAFATQTKTESIAATGHTEVTDKAVDATCTTTGLTVGKHCSVCGTVLTAQTTTPARGHEYNSVVTKKATCTEEGKVTYTCIRNDHSYTETTPALGHTDTNPADNNCDRCGDVIKEVPGLGEVEVDNPDVEITYDPDTGEAGGVVPPSEDEEDEPFEIPEEELPEFIEFNYGKFESNTQYTPGQYATVEYTENVITIKQPVNNNTYNMAWWHIVKDSDGNILSTTAETPSLSRLPNTYNGTTFSNYIVYSLDDTSTLAMNGVDSNTIWFASIANSADDTLDNAIYLAAVAQKQHGYDVHIAKWNGTQYVDQGKDTEIDAVNSFTISTPVTKTKQVLISKPTSTTTYAYVPVGTLQAEEGMTWAEWLASDYNTTGETTPAIKTADFEDVSYDDVIVAGESYGFAETYDKLQGTWYLNDTFDEWFVGNYNLSYELGGAYAGQELSKLISSSATLSSSGLKPTYINSSGVTMYLAYRPSTGWTSEDQRFWVIHSTINEVVDDDGNPVGEDLYAWLCENATKLDLSGTWMFNEDIFTEKILAKEYSPSSRTTITQNINFTTNNGVNSFSSMQIANTLGVQRKYVIYAQLLYDTVTTANGVYTQMDTGYVEGTGTTWTDEAYRTVDFGAEPQAVSKEFYEWFTANATQKVITFTVGGVSFSAEAGMTWQDWIESDYNLDDYYISMGYIAADDGYIYYSKDGDAVRFDEEIVANTSYVEILP